MKPTTGTRALRRRRLSERSKLALLAAALTLPLLVVACAYVNVEHGRLKSGQLERAGAAYLVPLSRLATAATLARHAMASGTKVRTEDVEAAAAAVDAADHRDGASLGVRAEWTRTSRTVRNAVRIAERAKAVAAYNTAVDQILTLMTHVREPSTALDGDVDTFYVMNAAIYQLPVLLDTPLRAVDAVLLDSPGENSTGAAGLAPMAAMAGRTTVLTNSLQNGLRRAFAATDSRDLLALRGSADQTVAIHRHGAQFVLDTAESGKPLPVEMSLLDPMIERTTALSAALLPVLRKLIDARITGLKHRIVGVAGATALAVMLAAWVLLSSLQGFRRDRDQAVAAAEAQAAFLATMSHEIRTPLNAVIGMTGVLMDTNLDTDQREYVTTVRDSGEALLSTINDILDFSKIESGELDLDDEPFDVQECVESALALLALLADRKDLELVGVVEDSCPRTLRGDVTRLRQILVNLLSNAVKFTDHGEVVITATAEATDPQGRVRLNFAVRDTGPGIPADRMDRVFRSFAQVDSSTTRVHGGTGLGLAISRSLAHAMGGDITVDSTVGVGSTFVATVILTACPGGDPGADTRIAGAAALIVDDNATNRQVLTLQLTGWGMRCTQAASAAEALRLTATGNRFDLAVLDLQMPDQDGIQLARALRADPSTADLPLILLSSIHSRPDAADRSLFAAMLAKPARAAQLHDHVRRALASAVPVQSSPDGVSAPAEETLPAPLRVLLAEDNTVNQRVAQLLLSKLGQRVDTVANGLEALRALERAPYDLVLMDVQMPVMDGLEATRRIRADIPADRQPRIVAMTASVLVEDRTACRAAGMDDYLPKPVRADDLRAVLLSVPCRSPDALGHPVQASRSDASVSDAIRDRLRELAGPTPSADDRELVVELLHSFLANTAPLVTELEYTLHAGDLESSAAIAHRLIGTTSNLNIDALAEACAEIERALRTGPLTADRIGILVTAAREQLDRAIPHLARAVADLAPASSPVPSPPEAPG
ncbi:hybrid sensor histidine kinase/response regulator [Cryptosporangium phraense]|uniref:Circadian input-output histidine kinase CikA n=1 Tax=Cryptosporangium phraense TaxID=2593070 RepID=A0A545AEP8_9ACTN|nr:response regulator [Cryptosporangium phraense]TQS39802.1 response regulator [Cryptosporangium phraense]